MSSSCDHPVIVVDRESHPRQWDVYDGKHESSGTERSNDFRPASPYFHGRHEFSKKSNSCWKSTKDHSSSSKSLSRSARDYHKESPLRSDHSYKCYSREKSYSRKRFSKSSDVCYVCGRQDHYKKVCSKIECRKCYKKGHISRECPLRESGYFSGHSSDRIRSHEQHTEDGDKCSVSVGMVRFASCGNIIDSHINLLVV